MKSIIFKITTIANVPGKNEWKFLKFSGFSLNLKMKAITIFKYACYICGIILLMSCYGNGYSIQDEIDFEIDMDIENMELMADSLPIDSISEELNRKVYTDFLTRIYDIEILLDNRFKGYVYVGRDTCLFCLQFNPYLKNFLSENEDIEVLFFDTDYWRANEYFGLVLGKFGINSVPVLLKVLEDGTYESSSPSLTNSEVINAWIKEFFSS